MLKFFKLFWRAISALLLFLGILWFPKDLLDTSEALKPWRDIIDMVEIDQLTAFKILAGFLTLWIVWVDLRPFFSRFKEKKWPKELTKPKFEFFFDVISFGWEDNLFVIDCTIKNVGVPAEVRAKISSHRGVWKAPGPSASKPVPASWRYGNQPSQALIKNQTESIRAFIVNKKNKTISIPYVSEKRKD